MGTVESIEWKHLPAFSGKAVNGIFGLVHHFLRVRPVCVPSFRQVAPSRSNCFKATKGGDRRDFIQACLRPTVAVSD